MEKYQLEKVFFSRNAVLSEDKIRQFRDLVNPNSDKSPFSKFVGNSKAIQKLSVVAFNSLHRYNHSCRDISFAITGPASSGKTTLVRLFSEILQIPVAEISPKSVSSLDDLTDQIANAFLSSNIELTELKDKYYCLPPCIVFIDEVHALKNSVVQGLLKATEPKDSILVTESGLTIDCFNVCWIIATTDIGKLFDAFRTRFSLIELKYLTKKEVARIVKINHPEFSDQVCGLISHYNPKIPRKALEFSKYVTLYKKMNPEKNWDEVCSIVAENEGIDKYGMHESYLAVLKVLASHKTVSLKRLPYYLNRKIEEIESSILPWLMAESEEQASLVSIGPKGLSLTKSGIQELKKRNLLRKKGVYNEV